MKSFEEYITESKWVGPPAEKTKELEGIINTKFEDIGLQYIVKIKGTRSKTVAYQTKFLELRLAVNKKKYAIQNVSDANSIFSQIGVSVEEIDFDSNERKAVTNQNTVYKIKLKGKGFALLKGSPARKEKTGGDSGALPVIANKSFAPDMCGIPLDKELNKRQIVTAANKAIKSKGYPPKQQKFLLDIVDKCSNNKSWADIDLTNNPPKENFDTKSLAKFAVDFGEVLAGILLCNVFDTVRFPKESNYKIADVFVTKKGTENIQGKLVSVKSGAGSGTAFSGFTTTLKMLQTIQSVDGGLRNSQAFHPNNTTAKEYELIDILQNIISTKAWDTTTPLAIAQDTAYVKAFKKVTRKRTINTQSIADWVQSHNTPEELASSLDNIKTLAGMGLKKNGKKELDRLQSALNGNAPEGVVLVSMTNQLASHLTKNYGRELTRVIGKLDAFQFNVDWNRSKTGLTFNFKRFRQQNWKFKFAGNSKEFQNKISFIKEGVVSFGEFINEII
tara:strand:- start:5754 stop:7262 length:1509 start_codon:yes stop_codon:yes gene_type:complete